MFKVFKNALVYQIARTIDNLTEDELCKLVPNAAFTPCSSHDASRTGWLMNDDKPAMFVHGNNILLVAVKETKDVPAAMINAHVSMKREKLENNQTRKLRRTEVAQIKDEVFQELLPRAFPKKIITQVWIDVDRGLITLDTASPRTAENILALLRKTLGSLPAVPIATKIPVELVMTDWLKDVNTLPDKIQLSEKIRKANLFHVLTDGGEVRFNKADDLASDDAVAILLGQGRIVCSLGLHIGTQYGLDLELDHSCTLKKLQFGEAFLNQNDDCGSDDEESDSLSREYADFILMVDELRSAYGYIFDAMGCLQESGAGRE
ncbi:recombination-associated protein RdgC [Yersinia ruckeri]|uniref:recombination-associated protein RdgC n=1 Tax=Yersinia ruckeri TaxID=29486 RepID=UPI002238C00B|nr:recombination-associated protein RdgC [Yersinia ruckeri]MCW6615639.1 recombination-associated protein RdgC [Yersinia ruckeri]